MELFVGLDVSVRTTSICAMDTDGRLIRESRIETEPEAIADLGHIRGAREFRLLQRSRRIRYGGR